MHDPAASSLESLLAEGKTLAAAGRLNEALQVQRNAAAQWPGDARAQHALGTALARVFHHTEAIPALQRALAILPTAETYSNLGASLAHLGRLEEAVTAFEQALALHPEYTTAACNLGRALHRLGRTDEALAALRDVQARDPTLPLLAVNLGAVLLSTGHVEEALALYRQSLSAHPGQVRVHDNLVYVMHFMAGVTAEELFREHQAWNHRHAVPLRPEIRPLANARDADRRLRVGYISPDFREHVVGRFIAPLLAGHHRDRVEVFAYSDVTAPDALTQHVRGCVHQWRDIVGHSDTEVANMVRADGIDILVDLAAHLAGNRLLVFARRPAPLQVTYLAYCGTTGLETMNYRLSDPYLDPADGAEQWYSERTIRLPATYWCYDPPADAPDIALPAYTGLITFGCLNNFAKVSPAAQQTWARLLRALPVSRLLLHCAPGIHRDAVTARLAQGGVQSQRIEFVPQLPRHEYFQLYQRIDIALDPFPYAGGTTTCDALWMGVPVVSLCGRIPVARGGWSILSNVGLPELVARSPDEYVHIAVDLARDGRRLMELRRTLRARMRASPLMDPARFVDDVEAAYRTMWRRWCADMTDAQQAGVSRA